MITAEELRERVKYDPETGIFYRKFARGRLKQTGTPEKDGYLVIDFRKDGKKRQYKAHRLAWLYVYGEWPKGEIDHIDGDRKNNRIVNLRDVDVCKNRQNRPRSDNATGYKGVYKVGSKYRAQVQANRVTHHLGPFDSAEEAYAAYLDKAKELHGDFVHETNPVHKLVTVAEKPL